MRSHPLYSISFLFVMVFVFFVTNDSRTDGENKNIILSSASCVRESHFSETNTYSSDVAIKWMDMQLELIRTSAPFIGGLPPSRPFAYAGIALYEAVVPGMPDYRSLSGQLALMPAMPKIVSGNSYHWPTCANAALAAINRNFFPNASDENKAAINALENELNAAYQSQTDNSTFRRSVNFGRAVASLIFDWSKSDGYTDNINKPYTAPAGQ